MIIIPFLNDIFHGYFIGKINPTFSDKPTCLHPGHAFFIKAHVWCTPFIHLRHGRHLVMEGGTSALDGFAHLLTAEVVDLMTCWNNGGISLENPLGSDRSSPKWTRPGEHTYIAIVKMAIEIVDFHGFSHETWWFSIAMLVHQRVSKDGSIGDLILLIGHSPVFRLGVKWSVSRY